MKVQKAAVIGAGAMGSGIAQVLSQAGIQVILKDVEQAFVDRGLANIQRMYASRVKRETLTQSEADQLFDLIKGTTSYDDFSDVDLVIEAALETIEVKLEIFRTLDKICPSRTVLASNTSALSISEIASATSRPGKVVGMHFFNPAQTMKLVEVIPGVKTSPETVEACMELCRLLHKVAVKVNECPGFLVNRLLFPYMNEALYVLQSGEATAQEIDEAAVAFGLPMGPLTLFDMTGLDVCAHVNNFLQGEYGARFETAPLLLELVKSGHLGQKSGSGLYLHDKNQPVQKGEPKKLNPELTKLIEKANSQMKSARSSKQFDVYRIILPMFNEAVYAVQEQVVKPEDVDVAMEWGTGLKRGLLSIAKEKGLGWCLSEMEQHHKDLGERFRPSWLLSKLVRGGIKDFTALEPAPMAVR